MNCEVLSSCEVRHLVVRLVLGLTCFRQSDSGAPGPTVTPHFSIERRMRRNRTELDFQAEAPGRGLSTLRRVQDLLPTCGTSSKVTSPSEKGEGTARGLMSLTDGLSLGSGRSRRDGVRWPRVQETVGQWEVRQGGTEPRQGTRLSRSPLWLTEVWPRRAESTPWGRMSSPRGVREPGCVHTNTHLPVCRRAAWTLRTLGRAATRASQP